MSDTQWTVRAVALADESAWRDLYRGYRRFYEMPDDEGALDVVWGWLHDDGHEVSGYVMVDQRGTVGGLAHVRPYARPLSASTGLYLDDLFVDPGLRGGGLGRSLLQFLSVYAAEQGFDVVSWMTAEDNATARGLYDSVATTGPWLTYDMDVQPPD